MENGWICLYRKIRDHWLWNDPVKLKWWLDILLQVNHSDKVLKINIGMQIIECGRGQTVMSLQNWAERWNVSKSCARHFLSLLVNDNMIVMENVKKSTRITVCNYDSYNSLTQRTDLDTKSAQIKPYDKDSYNQPAHARETHEKRMRTQTTMNNNENNENSIVKTSKIKKMKNERFIIPPTVEMVRAYCEERKNKVDPEKFVNNYEAKGWKIGNNKMIDWQASVRTWESNGKKYDNHGDTKNNNRQIKNVNALWDNTL